MATTIEQHSFLYNDLPHLLEAQDTFTQQDPLKIIEREISALFLKHEVYNELSISLIHRHFELQASEKLVEFGSVSTPWPDQAEGSALLLGGQIVPRSWLFHNGQMVPYEYGYNEHGVGPAYQALPEKPQFYAELNTVLVKYGLNSLLGLQLVSDKFDEGKMKMERTFDRANVMFSIPWTDPGQVQKEYIDAQWVYRPLGNMAVPVKSLVCSVGCVCSRGD